MRRRRGLLPFEQLLPHLDLIARPCSGRPENRLQLLLGRRRPRDAEAPLGAIDAEGAPRWPRPVDEEVDHLISGLDRSLVRLGRDELEQRLAELVETRAGRRRDPENAENPG